MTESNPDIIVTAIGHDPAGRWAKFFDKVNNTLDENYEGKLISFSPVTHPETIKAAIACEWDVVVDEASINLARIKAVERGLKFGAEFINYWDGDRLLHAATVAPHQFRDLTQTIPQSDFFILGATEEAIETHPRSLIVWEKVKSLQLGRYLGIEGDIANRGCFGFSREFATFLLTYQFADSDETDSLFPMMALAYQKLLTKQGDQGSFKGIGYKEYPDIAAYEDWLFKDSTSAEGLRQENDDDFVKRRQHVERILQTADKIADMYGLTSSK